MEKEKKTDIFAALLAGGVGGAICLLALLFIGREKWYLCFPAAIIIALAVWKKMDMDKKKNAMRYRRDEHLIEKPFFIAAEGYLREESDKYAKFFFGEEGVSILSHKHEKPIVEFIGRENINGKGFDRCGWLSILIKHDRRRIVIPEKSAGEVFDFLEEKNWFPTE